MNSNAKAILFIMVIGIVAALPFVKWPESKPSLVAVCEETVKDRLRAPATFKRVDSIEAVESIPYETYINKTEESPNVRALRLKVGGEARRSTVLLTFDAANSFGVPIRHKVLCTHEWSGEPNPSKFNILLNGKSYFDAALESAKDR